MNILSIESSCDETAAAVVTDGRTVVSNFVASQIEIHKRFGGVVPEVASRCHCENIVGITANALRGTPLTEIDAVAVSNAPGLIGALLVGVSFAKSLAFAADKPIIPVNHISAHIASLYLSSELEPPFLALIVSGGHTLIAEVTSYTDFKIIARTRDDAAGECFDKCARALGFPYPGGLYIDRAANSAAELLKTPAERYISLPTPRVDGAEFDFSFSGLKTAVLNFINQSKMKREELDPNLVAFALQKKIAEILRDRTLAAAEKLGYKKIGVAGGVSANSGIRAAFEQACAERGYKFFKPELKYCGDNAAMVGSQAFYNYKAGITGGLDLNAFASI